MTIVLLVKQKISKMKFRGNSELHCVLEHVFCFLRGAIEARGNSCTLLFEFVKKNVVFQQTFIVLREGFKKSKWKFKMAFAMKGGGSRPVSSATYLF